ncbi:MAG: hypothetical protein ACRDYU_08645 [Actinomycetes bacterium]
MPARFAGPPGSANGGYLCGRLSAHVPTHGAVVVTLRLPPPLDAPMTVERHGDGAHLLANDRLVAEAMPAELDVDVVEPVDHAEAVQAATRYDGFTDHPFPACFVCGPERAAGDGLRLFPGRVQDQTDSVAGAWVPDASLAHPDQDEVPEEFVWAALDCPGGWAVGLARRPMVLGRMTGQVDAIPKIGERCVVMGRVLGQEGRKAFTTSTAYDGDGRVLGRAHAVWIAVDPSTLTPA